MCCSHQFQYSFKEQNFIHLFIIVYLVYVLFFAQWSLLRIVVVDFHFLSCSETNEKKKLKNWEAEKKNTNYALQWNIEWKYVRCRSNVCDTQNMKWNESGEASPLCVWYKHSTIYYMWNIDNTQIRWTLKTFLQRFCRRVDDWIVCVSVHCYQYGYVALTQ